MKQFITETQWNQLKEDEKKIICSWIEKTFGMPNLDTTWNYITEMSIGLILGFIEEYYKDIHIERGEHNNKWGFSTCREKDKFTKWVWKKELIDILWEVLKHIIKNEKNISKR